MGIRNLLRLLRKHAPSSLTQVDLSSFATKTVVIDTTLYAYQSLYTSYRRPHADIPYNHISQEDCDRLLLLRGLFFLARRITSQQNNIKPLFIFDGPGYGVRSVVKAVERERRQIRHQQLMLAIQKEDKRHERLNKLGQFMNDLSSRSPKEFEYVVDGLNTQSCIMDDAEAEADDSLVSERVVGQKSETDVDQLKEGLAAHVNALNELLHDKEANSPVKSAIREELALIEAIKHQGCVEVEHSTHLQLLQRHQLTRHDKLKARVARMTPSLVESATSFFDIMKLPHYTITTDDYEGELVCASLVAQGLVEASLTEDTDAILVGDGLVIQKLGRNALDPNAVLVVDPKEAREGMRLTYDQFLDLCILLGTDFSGTVANVGEVRALNLMRKHGSIEKILENEVKLVPNENFFPDTARNVFRRQYIPDETLLSIIEKTRVLDRNYYGNVDRDMRQYLKEQGINFEHSVLQSRDHKRWERFPGE